MTFKTKLLLVLVSVSVIVLFVGINNPRLVSWAFSYKKECRVLRVEAFAKGMIISNFSQANKFALICADDGFICRAEDTAFASVKPGDLITFRGFPEVASLEEFWKCDHAQLLELKNISPRTEPTPTAAASSPAGLPNQQHPVVQPQVPKPYNKK